MTGKSESFDGFGNKVPTPNKATSGNGNKGLSGSKVKNKPIARGSMKKKGY